MIRCPAGNSPWPIGVTSVGIHERSAREKISHVMNGAAHVMNNEATRKYLQALKRLLTFMQRAHPTDPSRSVEFDGYKDAGRGVAGGGSDKRVRGAVLWSSLAETSCVCLVRRRLCLACSQLPFHAVCFHALTGRTCRDQALSQNACFNSK